MAFAGLLAWVGAARAQPTELMRWEPSIRVGVLPNGLRYAVQSNALPKGAVSLRLSFAAGSYDEAEDEQGVAHFVEHMGFNGSRQFPENRLDTVFAPLGVAFGRDHNASTSLTRTHYQLDLPATATGELDAAFLWLRDVADGMLFEPRAVARERGVVQAERETHATAPEALGWRNEAFQMAGLRSAGRDPLGSAQSVATMTPERLRRFYDRWYRPELASVVVVGDLPVELLEARVRQAFGDWTGRGPAGVRPPRAPPQGARGLEVRLEVDPKTFAAVAICRVTPPDPEGPYTREKMRTAMLRGVWAGVLERRLKALATRPDPAVLEATILADPRPDALKTCIVVVPAKGQVKRALAEADAEIRRFASEGPTDEEVDAGLEDIRAFVRGAVGTEATESSADRATVIVEKLIDGHVRPSARDGMRAFNMVVEDIDPAAAKVAFARDWSGWGPLVSVSSPEAMDEAAVRQAMAGNGPARAAPTAAAARWAYDSFGTAGRVVSREVVAPGFLRLRFSNGLLLNFKQTAFEGRAVKVRLRFGGGRLDIPSDDMFLAELGAAFFKDGGLGRHSYAEVQEIMRNNTWDLNLRIGDQFFMLDGDTRSGALASQLDLLAAYMSDPGFRADMDTQIATGVDNFYRTYRSRPSTVLQEALAEALTPGAPNNLPPPEKMMAARAADFARLLKPAIIRSPLELTIVGDVDEKTAVAEVARTFGALPRRAPVKPQMTPWFMRFPQTLPSEVRVQHQGGIEQAMLGVYWPLYVATPTRRSEEYSLVLLSIVLRDELRHRIREDLGLTYDPTAYAYTPDEADQGYVAAVIETSPGDAEAVLREVRATAERLVREGVSDAALERARKPMLSQDLADASTNDWWASLLAFSTGDGQGMKDLMQRRAFLSALTTADLNRAAADWLARPSVAVIAMPAQKEASR